MNKVYQRCEKDACAKFHYASKRMFFESKMIKVLLYIIAIIPIVLTFLPNVNEQQAFICTMVSFALTIINEATSSAMNNHKEKAILLHQLYEAEITGSTFSKIEYDREMTNELQELAIRKGLPKMRKLTSYNVVNVHEEITDDYSYIYLCRRNSASDRYLLSRIFYYNFFLLMLIVVAFIALMFYKTNVTEYMTLIIGFYPLLSPIIKDCFACKTSMKKCAKICADIDNFFADGDSSIERLARFYYYVQTVEFEMMMVRPAIFNIFPCMFKHGIRNLHDGVTVRFIEAIHELKGRSLMLKGALSQPKGKGLITKVELDYDKLKKIEKEKKVVVTKRTTQKPKAAEEPVVQEEVTVEEQMIDEPKKKVTASRTKKEENLQGTETPKKRTTSKTVTKSPVVSNAKVVSTTPKKTTPKN